MVSVATLAEASIRETRPCESDPAPSQMACGSVGVQVTSSISLVKTRDTIPRR